MRFECNRTDFLDALINCSRAAAQKSALAVIEGILMRASGNGLHICCYNLDMGIAKNIPAHIHRTGSAVMPMKLIEMIRRLPGERVIIDCSEKLVVHIESDLTEFDIIAMPADDFPELPIVESEFSVQIEESKLRSIISQTSHAIYTNADKPIYTGALFEVDDGSLKVTTLDGCRVAIRNETVNSVGSSKFIVPGKSLTDVSRLLSDSEETAEINVGKHNIVFLINGYSVVSRLLTGKFTDCSMLFNLSGSRTVKVKTADVLAAVERMALVISESYKSPVRCTFSENKIKFSCETPVGRADSVISSVSDDVSMTMGINNRFMVDAFKAVDTDEIRIMIVDRMRPMIILPPEGEHYKFLIMPLNLNDAPKENTSTEGDRAPRRMVEAETENGADYEAEADFGEDRYDD